MLTPYLYHSQPQQLMGYADASTKIPSIAWKIAKTEVQKRELEHLWAQYPEWAYRYAQDVIRKRWPPGEAAIAGNAGYAFQYAKYMIRKPWPSGEAVIAARAAYAVLYARDVIGKPWPPGEAAIAGDARWAKEYQKEFKIKL